VPDSNTHAHTVPDSNRQAHTVLDLRFPPRRSMSKQSTKNGRAMAQAVSRRPATAEAQVRFRFSPCRICGRQSGTGTGFYPTTSGFPCQFHSTGAPLLGKMKKLIIFIAGLHDKPQGCGASVASAAGPFSPPPPQKEILKKNWPLDRLRWDSCVMPKRR
jgi:hypothetical protein